MASIRLPKRLFDLAGALAGLIAFSPAMAVIAGAILLEDGWPVLFRQERLGRRRRPFTILKFRSMRHGRITRIGRMLRATGLDELPQFVNILGITAGTSTPDEVVDRVDQHIRALAAERSHSSSHAERCGE